MAKTGKALNAGEVRAEDYIVRNASFHFLFLPRCCLQGGFLFLRFPRGQRLMAKTGKAYICRRSTNRKLYRSKCEGCFHFLFLPRCRLQGGFLFLRFPRGQRIMAQNWKSL